MSDDFPVQVKVTLLGKSGVGKSSIMNRFIFDKFDQNIPSTGGVSFVSKEIYLPDQDRTLTFNITDTVGQEKFRSLASMFYRDAKIIIFVYSIIDQSSFEEIQEYWYQATKEECSEDVIYAVVGNKSDLYKKEQVNSNEAIEFAKSINGIFQETSALSNTGIDVLFKELAKKFVNAKYDPYEKENKMKELYNKEEENTSKYSWKLTNPKDEPKKQKKSCC